MIAKGIETSSLVTWGVQQWRDLKGERTEKEAIWQECWLAYDSKFGKTWDKVKSYRSRRYVPISFQAVEAIAANFVQGCMPNEDWFNVMGRTPDDDSASKYMAALLKWQYFRSGRRAKISQAIKKACIFGVVPIGMFWKEEMRSIPDMGKHAENLGQFAADHEAGMNPELPGMPTKKVRKYDGPDMVVGNIFDFVEDRNPNDKNSSLQIIRSHKTRDYLNRMNKPDPITGYRLFEGTEDLHESTVDTETSDGLVRQVNASMGLQDNPKDKVELLEFHGDFEVEGQSFPNHVMVIANRQKVIRFEPNPYYHGKSPWTLFSLYPDPQDLYGKGVIEPVLGLQDGINCFFNQGIEARALAINPKLEIVNDGLFDIDSMEDIPGAIYLVNQANSIRPIQIPDTGGFANDQIGFMSSQFNDVTGALRASDAMGGNPSATLTNAVQNQINARFGETIRHIEQTLLIPMLDVDIELNQQFMDEELWIRVVEPSQQNIKTDPMTGQPISFDPVGPAPMRIAPDDIRGDLDIYPVGAAWVANTAQRVGQMIQATQMIAQSPAAADIKWGEYAKELYSMMGVREAYKFIKTDAEKRYDQQQAMAMQTQQAMGPGGGPSGMGASPGQPGPGGPQSQAGVSGAPSGGGAGQGPVIPTNGGPQSVG